MTDYYYSFAIGFAIGLTGIMVLYSIYVILGSTLIGYIADKISS